MNSCLECKKEFDPNESCLKKFCGKSCRLKNFEIRKNTPHKCIICNEIFKTSVLSKHKTCSKKCRIQNEKNIYREKNPLNINKISNGTIGAIGELKVCVDLMQKGFFVYRAVSPSCQADLAVTFNNQFFRVEVTTGTISQSGKINHPKKIEEKYRYDILAICLKTGGIHYIPELSEIIKNKEQVKNE